MEAKATLVVDTSSMLGELETIQKIAQGAETVQLELLIPRETIRELDRIKDREKMNQLGTSARKAINWISDFLTNQDPRFYQSVRGQRHDEVGHEGLRGDESILDCALYNMKIRKNLTIMISQDTNLLNRALIDGIETLNCQKLASSTEEVLQLISQQADNVMECDWNAIANNGGVFSQHQNADNDGVDEMDVEMDDGIPEEPHTSPSVDTPKPLVEHTKPLDQQQKPPADLPPPVSGHDLQEKLVNNLSNLVDWHLKCIYGDDLQFLKYRKPNTSEQIARVIERYKQIFEEAAPQSVLTDFVEKVREGVLNKAYVQAHVQLLRALSCNSKEYFQILK